MVNLVVGGPGAPHLGSYVLMPVKQQERRKRRRDTRKDRKDQVTTTTPPPQPHRTTHPTPSSRGGWVVVWCVCWWVSLMLLSFCPRKRRTRREWCTHTTTDPDPETQTHPLTRRRCFVYYIPIYSLFLF